jgi:hypothetical protein
MKIKAFVLAAAISAIAGSALAEGAAQATLQNPLAKPFDVIAGDAYWSCQASACTAGAATDQSLTVSACKSIAKLAGPITAYTVDRGSLSAAQLAKCNTAAAAPAK